MNGVADLVTMRSPAHFHASFFGFLGLFLFVWLVALKAVLEFLICETEEEPRQAWEALD